MSSISHSLPVPAALPTPIIAVKARLEMRLLMEVAALVIPSWAMVAASSPTYAAYYYYSLLTLLCAGHAINKQPHRVSALLLATLPSMMIFRNWFVYNSPQVYYAAALLVWFEFRRGEFFEMLKDRLIIGLNVFAVSYWWIAYLITDDYSANLRATEVSLFVAGVSLLATQVTWLRTALLGVGFSILVQGLGLLGMSERLGYAEMGDRSIGNPISFGIPCVVLLVLLVALDGKWVMLQNRRLIRMGLIGTAGLFLLLSTSRGSWVIAFVCLCAIFVTDRPRRPLLMGFAVVVLLGGALITITPYGATFSSYIEKTFDPNVDINKRTTGRAEQWAAFPTALSDSPVWGHGPGTGRDMAAIYAGRYLVWHSLYLQIGVETGLIGLSLLFWFLFRVFRRVIHQYKVFADPIPLLGAIGYAVAGVSIPAVDATSALFLSLAMIRLRRQIVRVAAVAPQTAHLPSEFPELDEPMPGTVQHL